MKAFWLPWAAAAACGLLAAASVVKSQFLRPGIASRPAASDDLQIALLLPTRVDSRAAGQVVWDKRMRTGRFIGRNLDVLPVDKDYQLWIIDPAQVAPVSSGVFDVSADGTADVAVKPSQAVTEAVRFILSVERAGGASKVEGPFVLAGS